MIDLNRVVRPNIRKLKPYSSARDEYTGKDGIFLDANENPFGILNRYPDPYQQQLKKKLGALKNVSPENIFVGNGSDEVIDLAFRIFCNPGSDKALTYAPTYGMYDVSAEINNVELIKLPLTATFQMDLESLTPFLKDDTLKLIFICSPNNPTGNLMNRQDIEFILKSFNGIVIVDEAYIDFADADSLIPLIQTHNNLIVSQTFSKAWGLAAARVGTAYAHEDIITLYNKVKPPYNVSQINQEAAINALTHYDRFEKVLAEILKEKERLRYALQKIDLVKKIYPSDANFLLIEVDDADRIYQQLVDRKIIIRNRNTLVANCLRVTVGNPQENDAFLKALKLLK